MELWQVVLVAIAVLLGLLLLIALVLWRTSSRRTRALARRLLALPWQARLRLARSLASDSSVPLLARLIPPAVILYLALPLDIVPDFIPVLGQLDDVLVVLIGVGLLLRFAPIKTLEGHLSDLEAEQAAGPRPAPDQLPDHRP
jgi:uncharacterized membrane protein YkvA (DUF1232 family)